MVSAQKLTTNTQNYNHGAPYHNDTATDLDILNRAKKITLISYNDMATASQVAEYYEVESGALRACICRHRKELENDGLILMSSSEFIALHNPTLKERSRGRMVIKDDNGNEFTLSAGKTTFLPVKAILHIGMLLQESPVAIEVCKQLLCATTPSGKSQNQLQPTDRKENTPMASIQKLHPTTTTSVSTEEDIINDHALRDQMISRIEVLDKVKTLFHTSYNDMATARQVAEYYEVSINMLRTCVSRNREEIEEDGITVLYARDYKRHHGDAPKECSRGRIVFEDADGHEIILNPGKTMFLTKRAILRIGMLLRDSIIAKEVRTQLLNTHEQTTQEQQDVSMDEEKALAIKVVFGLTPEERSFELGEYKSFKDRHIHALEEQIDTLNTENDVLNTKNGALTVTNDALSHKELEWDHRGIVERLIKVYAANAFKRCPYGRAVGWSWNRFYSELYYEFRISLKLRQTKSGKKNTSRLDFVRPEEWPVLVAKAFALCHHNGYNVEEVIDNDVVIGEIQQCVEIAKTFVPMHEDDTHGTEQENAGA